MEVRGLDDLIRALPRFEGKLLDGERGAARVAAEHTADLTRVRLPRRSGQLARSVRVAQRRGTRQRVSVGRQSVAYAGWIEFGGTRGRPFMREGRYLFPASEQAGDKFLRDSKQETVKAIRGFPWPRP